MFIFHIYTYICIYVRVCNIRYIFMTYICTYICVFNNPDCIAICNLMEIVLQIQ
uniref:Uncharacterized protein n=1 Tax=Anguilla anguilla TaxID=7936 RepID=A0A0E9WQ02_ANGAN